MKKLMKIMLFVLISFSGFLKSQAAKDTAYENIQPYLYENPDKAIKIGKIRIESETNIDEKIKYHLYLSKAYTAKRNMDESYKTLLKAQKLLETSTNLESKINVLTLIAIQYQQMELYSKSFEILDEVDQLCENLDPKFDKQKYSWLGKSFAVKGIIYKSQDNWDIALEKFAVAIRNFEKTEQSVPTINNISIVYYNIGYCYINQNKFSLAESSFQKSISYAQKSDAQSLQAYAMKGLAENFAFQDQPQKAIDVLETAAKKSEKIGDLVLDEGIYKLLSDNYLVIGNFDKYMINNELYKKVHFEREQSELESINSLIDNIGENTEKEISHSDYKFGVLEVIMILISLALSGFLLFKILKINKNNKIKKDKIHDLISQ